jgi:hypothetical protein
MRNLQSLNYYRGGNYQEKLLANCQDRIEVERLSAESTLQNASQRMIKSEGDALDDMILDEVKSDNAIPELDDQVCRSASESSIVASASHLSLHESVIPSFIPSSSSDVDFSISPEVDCLILNSGIKIKDDPLPYETSEPAFYSTEAGIHDEDAAKTSIDPSEDMVTDNTTDDVMILSAAGSDHPLVHMNIATTNAAEVADDDNLQLEPSLIGNTAITCEIITPDCGDQISSGMEVFKDSYTSRS